MKLLCPQEDFQNQNKTRGVNFSRGGGGGGGGGGVITLSYSCLIYA